MVIMQRQTFSSTHLTSCWNVLCQFIYFLPQHPLSRGVFKMSLYYLFLRLSTSIITHATAFYVTPWSKYTDFIANKRRYRSAFPSRCPTNAPLYRISHYCIVVLYLKNSYKFVAKVIQWFVVTSFADGASTTQLCLRRHLRKSCKYLPRLVLTSQ